MTSLEAYQLEHTGSKHTHSERNVIYFHKYNFDISQVDYKEIKEREEIGFSKQQVLAASIVANEFNEGEYIKVNGGEFNFTETSEGSRYLQQKISNKQIVEGILFLYPHLIQDKHIEAANNIITELEVDFMFKVLAEDMTEFESNIASILGSTTKLDRHYWGTCAYLPTYAVKKVWERQIIDKSEKSVHLNSDRKDGKIYTEIEVLKVNISQVYGGYNVSALSVDGNRVSFYSSKEDWRDSAGKSFKIEAKVKSHGTVWKQEHIKETRLNYVKII